MLFSISGFTHTGTHQEENQDNILVNEHLLNDGKINLENSTECFCFVADGVGGNKSGRFASHFILNELKSIRNLPIALLDNNLKQVNQELLKHNLNLEDISGSATTLSGIIVQEEKLNVIHCGDSQIWLLRGEMFFKITNDHVWDSLTPNSPITNYFGGYEDNFKLDNNISVSDFELNDLFMVCSDGLFKSLKQNVVKTILKSQKDLFVKLNKIFENSLTEGMPDNVSVILIKRIE